MISSWKNPFDIHDLYKNISALQGRIQGGFLGVCNPSPPEYPESALFLKIYLGANPPITGWSTCNPPFVCNPPPPLYIQKVHYFF